MSQLIVYSAKNPSDVRLNAADAAVIARELAAVGARFERWEASHPLPPGASPEEILAA